MGACRRSQRLLVRFIKDTAIGWIFFFIIVFLCYGMTSLILTSVHREERRVVRQNPDFANAYDQYDLQRATLNRIWPPLKGYESARVSERSHPNDSLLLHRIELSQREIRTPLFLIKNRGVVINRHPWKFEKIIHQTWKTEEIPGQTADWVRKWLEIHPDWTYMFWTDENSNEFVKKYYPALFPVLKSWTIPVQKADMIRLLVLYTFGGVYADLDVEPLKPLDDIREWSSCILSREPDLQTYVMNTLNFWANNYTFTCNAFMACRSHHPFLHYLIGRLSLKSPLVTKRPCKLEQTIDCTGPVFVSYGYGYYLRSVTEDVRSLRRETDVICPKYDYFLPTFDNTREDLVKKRCNSTVLNWKQKEACDVWKSQGSTNQPREHSYTNHHWFHSYHYNVSKTHVNIHNVTKPLMWDFMTEDTYFDIRFIGL